MSRDLHNRMKVSTAIAPGAPVTDNTPFVSTILDTDGYLGNEFVWGAGSIADADVTFTLLFEESDASDMTGATAVADEDLLGTEAGAAPLFGSDNKCGKIGYVGGMRYLRVTITPANNTGNIYLSAKWIQAFPTPPSVTAQIV